MFSSIVCRPLLIEKEKNDAKKIVEKKYIQKGFIDPGDASNNTIATYLRAGSSEVFWAFIDDHLYGTLGFVFDSPYGIPLDITFKEHIDIIRKENLSFGEVVQFAVDSDVSDMYLSSLESKMSAVPLFGTLLAYAKKKEIQCLCISVNPKHVSFYESMGFAQMGKAEHYEAVNAPAVAMWLKIDALLLSEWWKNGIAEMIWKYAHSSVDT